MLAPKDCAFSISIGSAKERVYNKSTFLLKTDRLQYDCHSHDTIVNNTRLIEETTTDFEEHMADLERRSFTAETKWGEIITRQFISIYQWALNEAHRIEIKIDCIKEHNQQFLERISL